MLRRILVPFDGTALAEAALEYATDLARTVSASLVLVRSTELHPHLLPGEFDDRRALEAADASVKRRIEQLAASGLIAETLAPPPPDRIVPAIAKHAPDLVVVATQRGSGWSSPAFSPLADNLIAARVSPVLLIGAPARETQSRPPLKGGQVLVPLNGSALGEAALPAALELARSLQAELLLFQAVARNFAPYAVPEEFKVRRDLDVEVAWEPSFALRAAQAYLDLVANRILREDHGVRVRTEVWLGGLAEQIRLMRAENGPDASAAPGVGLIVMATHGRHGLGRLLRGSTTAEVVRAIDIPVVAVPAQQPTDSSAAAGPRHAA